MYDSGFRSQSYLIGIEITDENGMVLVLAVLIEP